MPCLQVNWSKVVSFWAFGFIALTVSAVIICFNRIMVQHLTSEDREDPLPAFYLIMVRQVVITLSTAPFVAFNKSQLTGFPKEIWFFLAVRSVGALATATALFFAITMISLPELVTIMAASPIITSLLSWPILKERPKITDIPVFLVCAAGIVFIVQPKFIFGASEDYSPPNIFGVLLTIGAVFGWSTIHICVRRLRNLPITSVNFIYGSSTATFALLVNLIFLPRWPPCSVLLRLETICIGLVSSTNIVIILLAGRSLPASLLSLSSGLELVLQLILQVILFQTVPKTFSIIGALVVLCAFSFFIVRNFFLRDLDKKKEDGVEIGACIRFLAF